MKEKNFSKLVARKGNKGSPTANETGDSLKGSVSSSKYLQAIFDSLEDELMVIDRDYRIIEANNAVLLRHGKRRDEILGRYCHKVTHGTPEPCNLPDHECPVRVVWNTGKPAKATHVHIHHVKDEKREIYVDILAVPLKDSYGNIIAVTELMRDVTEAKKLELKVTESHRNLLALYSIASVILQSLDLDVVLNRALGKTLEAMKVDTGGILLWDEERQTLSYEAHHGLSTKYVQEVRCRSGEGIAGRVAQTGQPILVEDASTDTRTAHPDLIAEEGLRAFASVPLRSKDKVLGVINIASREARKFSSEDIQLLDSIAVQIAIAIENAKLHQEVQRKEEMRGELLREIFSIQEEERRRIARELHDDTSQSLASLTASLEAAAGTLPTSIDKAKAIIRKAQALSVNILDEIHKLIYELRPTLLDDLGLVAATRWLADNVLGAAGIAVNFKALGRERRLSPEIETTLFRVVQEAIANIVRHAHAKNASVSLHFKKGAIEVHVRDDGRGFNVEEAISSKDRPRGLGLLGMKERIELMNGTLSILSRSGSGGTEINIEIPLK